MATAPDPTHHHPRSPVNMQVRAMIIFRDRGPSDRLVRTTHSECPFRSVSDMGRSALLHKANGDVPEQRRSRSSQGPLL